MWSISKKKHEKDSSFEKPYIKCGGTCVYLWINSLKCYTVCFYCMSKWRARPIAFISYKAISKSPCNICIVITSYLDCDVINFEIKLSFLIKPFSRMTEKNSIKI